MFSISIDDPVLTQKLRLYPRAEFLEAMHRLCVDVLIPRAKQIVCLKPGGCPIDGNVLERIVMHTVHPRLRYELKWACMGSWDIVWFPRDSDNKPELEPERAFFSLGHVWPWMELDFLRPEDAELLDVIMQYTIIQRNRRVIKETAESMNAWLSRLAVPHGVGEEHLFSDT